jgi:hypothetical protein
MNRPPLEVADIVRCAGQSFIERSRKWINGQHEKVLLAITRCRTAALGGHRDQCSDCGHTAISYNSCRNRHCPKCQGNARLRWLQARERELLPTRYVHVVFTLPRELAHLSHDGNCWVYDVTQVYGPGAVVRGNARVRGLAWVLGCVEDDAIVDDLVIVAQGARIGDREIWLYDEIARGARPERELRPARAHCEGTALRCVGQTL